MIKLAFNKQENNLVYVIDAVVREPIIGGVVEYYTGTLKDVNKTAADNIEDYKVQVMAFEQKWVEVPTSVAEAFSVNNQDKTVDADTEDVQVTADTGYTGLGTVTVNAVTAAIDENIVAENIKSGVTILGVTGTYTGE